MWPSSCVTPAGTSNELDVQNGWEENTHTLYYTVQYYTIQTFSSLRLLILWITIPYYTILYKHSHRRGFEYFGIRYYTIQTLSYLRLQYFGLIYYAITVIFHTIQTLASFEATTTLEYYTNNVEKVPFVVLLFVQISCTLSNKFKRIEKEMYTTYSRQMSSIYINGTAWWKNINKKIFHAFPGALLIRSQYSQLIRTKIHVAHKTYSIWDEGWSWWAPFILLCVLDKCLDQSPPRCFVTDKRRIATNGSKITSKKGTQDKTKQKRYIGRDVFSRAFLGNDFSSR